MCRVARARKTHALKSVARAVRDKVLDVNPAIQDQCKLNPVMQLNLNFEVWECWLVTKSLAKVHTLLHGWDSWKRSTPRVLLVVLRDLLPQRPDLRLILMSATLQTEKLVEHFMNLGIGSENDTTAVSLSSFLSSDKTEKLFLLGL